MKKIIIPLIAIMFLAIPVLASDVEMKAYAEGALQGQSMISLCATNSLVTLLDDGSLGIVIQIKPGDERYLQLIIYQGFDVCQKVVARYPDLPQCILLIEDQSRKYLATTVAYGPNWKSA